MRNKILPSIPDAYIVQNFNEDVRLHSTSGGMFSAIATYVLDIGGTVYGAAFDDAFFVRHIGVERKEDLVKLQESKYVQSYLGDCFKEIRKKLDDQKTICFSGTPCQIEGLLNYLGKDYDNLITVGVVCYGVPSPKLFSKYILYIQEKYNDKLLSFHFRSKKYGYASPTVVAEFARRGKVDSKSEIKSFTKTYFNGMSLRPSCYECKVKTERKRIDFLLGDCWRVSDYEKNFDDNQGTTSVFVYTEKGKRILEELFNSVKISKVDEKELLHYDCSMIIKCKQRNPKRDILFSNIDNMSYESLINMVAPDSVSNKIANVIKPVIGRMGAENSMLLKIVKKYRVKKNSKK